MGAIKGQKEYTKWQEGKALTRKQAQLANCYICNGESESRVDCQGYSCPMYLFYPYHNKKAVFSVKLGKYVVSNAKGVENPNLEPESGSFVNTTNIVAEDARGV